MLTEPMECHQSIGLEQASSRLSVEYLGFDAADRFPRRQTKTFLGNLCVFAVLVLRTGRAGPVVLNVMSRGRRFIR